jgi:hypothetical protein
MACGADSIEDLDVVRAGGTKRLFEGVYANATLGIFLREFTHGHTRQLSVVLRRHLIALAQRTRVPDGIQARCFIDIDSLLRPTHGHAKHGRQLRPHQDFGQDRAAAWPLSPLAVTICTELAAPVLSAVRLRAGRAGSAKGAASLLARPRRSSVMSWLDALG